MHEKLNYLKATISKVTKRKTRKRRYIAKVEGGSCNEGVTPAKRVRSERRCGRCSQVGHNSRTCQVELEDIEDSDVSEE
ncbi:hypothetical protein COCSADRAFT_346407 [Bipolaris sorokiniana ND90Pr]|uniref:CCHC-type domain-containing protein n=1 Tax=Cochliobolus sativus (strain ND90Pr / ATCC 201652) TaxID=665912 RepID=M2RY36_COCSN|nr:uncharacterized protein COCSADRAFT_346407 [Bipolaris sorokiniana ND90Pr]EMD59978.1 hypothetical protein COCSADRAFT_346407 [Bipolaris sorokiniana ND90Pr]